MCWPATLAIPLMLTVSETIKPSSVSLQTRMNISFANNPWYKPEIIIASVLFEGKGGEMLQYYIPFILKCPGNDFSSFLFPITNKSCTSLLSSRLCITVTASLQGLTTWKSLRSPLVDIPEHTDQLKSTF